MRDFKFLALVGFVSILISTLSHAEVFRIGKGDISKIGDIKYTKCKAFKERQGVLPSDDPYMQNMQTWVEVTGIITIETKDRKFQYASTSRVSDGRAQLLQCRRSRERVLRNISRFVMRLQTINVGDLHIVEDDDRPWRKSCYREVADIFTGARAADTQIRAKHLLVECPF